MNIHKTVTEKVVQANRKNAERSTGPKSTVGKLAVRYNGVKHGLLAKQILFRHDETRQQEFKDFLDGLEHDLMPVGTIERMLVEEIGACWWKLQAATKWELKEFRNRRSASKQVISELQGAGCDLDLFDQRSEGSTNPQWECETLVVRSTKGTSHTKEKPGVTYDQSPFADHSASTDRDRGCLEVEATLTSSLPTILRYETNLKRDYYRAIDTLRDLQRRRQEGLKEKTEKQHRNSRATHLRIKATKSH